MAASQHGVVSLAQLLAIGISREAVSARTRQGRLHRTFQGVFAVGNPVLTQHGRWMAGVLACGPGALLSHLSAAALWGLVDQAPVVIDVASMPRRGRFPDGIRGHRANTITDADRTVHDGIPVTTVARTLLDLSEQVGFRRLERAFDRAEVLGLIDWSDVGDVLERARGRRGLKPLRRLLVRHDHGTTWTRNELEERFFSICDRAVLRRPLVNARLELDGWAPEVDFFWPAERLVVETDGGAAHTTRQAFERDRRRDQQLTAAGYRVVRFTWRQVRYEPRSVETTLRALLT